MGQYYLSVKLDQTKRIPVAYLSPSDIKFKWTRNDGKVFYMGTGVKLMEHSWLKNSFVHSIERLLTPGNDWYKSPIVWAGDYADQEPGASTNIYGMCEEEIKVKRPKKTLNKKYHYIVNHDKKLYVDKRNVPCVDGWGIHPLPLLTCEGNGRGGGDYRKDSDLIGSWARNVISVEDHIPEGYNELIFDLTE